ncbi:MAG: glycosyltransferase family 4 protein [Alicyclobacillus sp.]|nr:glycosyltransferase family 4 protein [Alicyclobacillus sp.]
MPYILILAPGNERGGAATHLLTLAKVIRNSDRAASIRFGLVGDGYLAERMRASGDAFIEFPSAPLASLGAIRRYIARSPRDLILHAHGPRLNVLIAWLAKRASVRWTTTLHSHPDFDFLNSRLKSLIFSRLNRLSLALADGVFVINPKLAKVVPKQRTFVVPNAIQMEPLPMPKSHYESVLRQRLGVSDETILVGTAARLDPVKDLGTIVRALDHLRDLPIHLALAGDGPDRDELQRLAQTMAVADKVHLLGFLDEVRPFYAGLNIHVLSSRSEGTPSSVLEAGFIGIPTIGSDIPGITQMVVDGRTGLVFPVGDAQSLADAIRTLVQDGDMAARLASRFRDEVLPRFSPERMLQCYLDGYAQLSGIQTSENAVL